MADIHTKAVRSFNMSRIKSKNTKPELIVRKHLFAHGFRYLIHVKKMIGSPDIVLPKYKTAIYINGCFWHGHDACKLFRLPKTRSDWWLEKINRNKTNDRKNQVLLLSDGWEVLTIWECQLKSGRENTLKMLIELLQDKF